MPDEPGIRILGLSRFRSTLKKAGADMGDMKEANIRAADIVVEAARALAPKRSGRLRDSLKPQKSVARARIQSDLIYAPVIHYGWPRRNIAPNPFLTKAAANTRDRWLTGYAADLEEIVNKVKGD